MRGRGAEAGMWGTTEEEVPPGSLPEGCDGLVMLFTAVSPTPVKVGFTLTQRNGPGGEREGGVVVLFRCGLC